MKTTTDYEKFHLMQGNRDVDLSSPRTKRLAESMLDHGWLDGFPLIAKKNGVGLVVIDGQHRLAIARDFGITVKYVVETKDIDVAALNSTAKIWNLNDYINRYASLGNSHYQAILDLHAAHPIPVSIAAAMLANNIAYGNIRQKIANGEYRVTNLDKAYRVADCYRTLINIDPRLKKAQSIKGLWACFHVSYFSANRLISGAEKNGGAIRNMGNVDGFLDLYESLYNFGQRAKAPLRFDAEQAMRQRGRQT